MRFISGISVNDIEKRRYPDKHYEYVIRVKWSNDVVNIIYRRYSQFYELHSQLINLFPVQGGVYRETDRTLPYLPGKILFGRSHIRKVALERLQPISDYCQELIKLPENISHCSAVLQFFETQSIDLLPREVYNPIGRQSRKSIKSISQPVTWEQYEVLLDYQKEEPSELSIWGGSVVDVIEKRETGWWFVRAEDGEGWVPSAYLQKVGGAATGEAEDDGVIPIAASEALKYICTRAYIPQEPDEIELDKGCQVQVLEKNLDGWWLVKYKGKSGRAPAIYLSRTDTLKANRIRATQQDALSDDFSTSSFEEFSSSDTSMEHLNLSWEVLNKDAIQSHTSHLPYGSNIGPENPAKKPLRPPPPVVGNRREAPPQLPSQGDCHGISDRKALFNKDAPSRFRVANHVPPIASYIPPVSTPVQLYQNFPRQKYQEKGSVSEAISVTSKELPMKHFNQNKPKGYPLVLPKPMVLNKEQMNATQVRQPSNFKAEFFQNQGPVDKIQLPEFYNIRLKPVNQAKSISNPQPGNNNVKPALPPKPRPS